MYPLSVLRSRIPAHLLVPYVAAAAREVASGLPLSPRSIWAVEDAHAQLDEQYQALTGEGYSPGHGGSVALMAASGDDSLEFASLVLERERGGSAASLADHEAQASSTLQSLVADLGRLLDGDQDSAKRTSETFDAIVAKLAPG